MMISCSQQVTLLITFCRNVIDKANGCHPVSDNRKEQD